MNFIILIINIEVRHPPDICTIEPLKSCSKQILDVNSHPSPPFLTLSWCRTWSLAGSGCLRTREAIRERLYSSLNSDSTEKKQQIYNLHLTFSAHFLNFSHIYFFAIIFLLCTFLSIHILFTSLPHQVFFKITAIIIIIISTFCISITYFVS